MPGPEPSASNGGPALAAPPPMVAQAPPPPDAYDNMQTPYPSLAFPPAGPSQPPQHYPPQGAWPHNPYNPYFGQQYPAHPNGPPRPPNGMGGFQAGGAYRYDHGYQAYPYPPAPYFQGYGQMPIPGPGPGTMQNGYFMPNYPRPYPGFDGDMPNGDDSGFNGMPFQNHQHQPVYPPNHPYAYGGGVGYHPQMPYNGGGGAAFRPDAYMPEHAAATPISHPIPSAKALNPAAAGFTFQPRKEVNGTAGREHREGEIVAPVPQKQSSLGLSLEPTDDELMVGTGVDTVHELVEEPQEEHEVAESVNDDVAKPPAEKPEEETAAEPLVIESPEPESAIKFTVPPLASYNSPRLALRRPKVTDPICVRPSRPSPTANGNSYAAHLTISDVVIVDKQDGVRRRRSTLCSPKPRGKPVYAVGVAGGRKAPELSLQFGEITEPPVTPPPPPRAELPPAKLPAPSAASAAILASVPTKASSSTAAAPMAAPAPAMKPSSWAALVREPKKGVATPDSLSVAASSTLPSPSSKSTISLPADTPVTPRSAAPALPGGTPARRPAFNYAAAASVGAPPTPAEDLTRLLTEGLRPRAPHAPALIMPRGLINTGNMCFANTILQVLVYCTPFTELFEELGKRLKADLARRTPLLEAMIIFLREFAPGPSSSGAGSGASTPKGKDRDRSQAFIPENVYDAMKENKRFDSMRRGYQEDAEEYLGFFLNTLHEELLGLYSRVAPRTAVKAVVANGDTARTINRPVSPGPDDSADDWLEVGKKQKTHVVRQAESKESSVSRIFGGTLRSVLHTPGQKDSVTLEPYQPLQLDVQDAKVFNIVDALRHLNEPETVGGVWSASRNANVDATKQVYLESFPTVLILHLKRFVYDPQEQNVVKRAKPVAYDTELVVPQEIISSAKRTAKPVTYRLFGVVYHHGHSATGGHYTVAVARPDRTGWLHFDDETVQPVPADSVVVSDDEARDGRAGLVGGRERCAYLLFYQRIR